VTAEISPHYRPATWNEIGHFETIENGQTKVNAPLAARLQAQPYRITGQLFFDVLHAPCPCGTHCHPARSTDWEIHPVYGVEVCKARTTRDVADDAHWNSFDTWWKSDAPGH